MKPQPNAKTASGEPPLPLKLAIELGPLLIFFGGNALYGIYAGTAAFMVATVISLGAAWLCLHKLPVMPLVSVTRQPTGRAR